LCHLGQQDGVPQFFLGGGLRLGAYGRDEIRTNQYFLLRAGYIHELGKLAPLVGEKIYALGFYELRRRMAAWIPHATPPT
jgi:NTE family protein